MMASEYYAISCGEVDARAQVISVFVCLAFTNGTLGAKTSSRLDLLVGMPAILRRGCDRKVVYGFGNYH